MEKKRVKKAAKSEAIKMLEVLAFEDAKRSHPSVDPRFLAPRLFNDTTTSGLQKCILAFLKLNNHKAERANSLGRFTDTTEVYTDVLGRTRQIGSAKWTPEARKVKADVLAEINNQSIAIIAHEVSDPTTIEAGTWIVEDFADFLTKYKGMTSGALSI